MTEVIVGGLLVIIAVAARQGYVWFKTRALRQRRATYTRQTFLAECQNEGLSPDVGAATWDYLVDWLGKLWFPLSLADSFTKTLHVAPDDLDDMVLDVAQKSGRKPPTTAEVAGEKPIKTVQDLIALVDRLPKEPQ